MPSRNTIRTYDAPAYYHVYNRGAGERYIFKDAQDKWKFLSLIERYLSNEGESADYPTYPVEVIAYCIMGNHFHLLLYQEEDVEAITHFMKSVATAYSMYFNYKYKTHGHVFQGVYRASKITDDAYLAHITRYIHLNPDTYRTYKWSSLAYFLGDAAPAWMHLDRIYDMSPERYATFLEDYEDRRLLLKEIKDQLAFI